VKPVSDTKRRGLMAVTIAGALLVAVAWSGLKLSASRAAADAAGRDLAECRALLGRIEQLRRRPAVADARELGVADLSRRIERAAAAAKFEGGAIESIQPEDARRVGETDYREVPTHVRFGHVTLRQVFTFFHGLTGVDNTSAGAALRLKDVRLTAPHGEETADRWTVESTLTYMIYAPTSVAASK